MDQIQIGSFLKTLRLEKSLTQEQLAEQFGVTGRTVSRWENGNNMPDEQAKLCADHTGAGDRISDPPAALHCAPCRRCRRSC